MSVKEYWSMIQIFLAALGVWMGYFLGSFDGLLIALIIFAAVDYFTGVLCAVADHELSSKVGFKGICRKILIFTMVGICHVLDEQVIGSGNALRTASILFYLSNEGISIIENATHLGLPVPARLKDVLKQIHDKSGEGGEDKDSKS